jgi:hypothetical protein
MICKIIICAVISDSMTFVLRNKEKFWRMFPTFEVVTVRFEVQQNVTS